jgi:diguanylate cyclase (GGDEF)-like protein
MLHAGSAFRRAAACVLAALCFGAGAATDVPPGATWRPALQSVGQGAIARDVVATLAQDAEGYLWIATGDGLVRFDGHRFRPLERADAAPARRNLGWIRALVAARDGRLWIGTEADGLAIYDPRTERVTDRLLATGAPTAAGTAQPAVAALAEDIDGAVWVGTMGGGLHRIDPADGADRLWRAAAGAGALPDDRVLALRVARDGTLWVGTWRGLVRLPRGASAFEPVTLPIDGPVQALAETADGRVWAGTQRGQVFVIDAATGRARAIASDVGSGAAPDGTPIDDTVAAAPVTALAEAPAGRLWVARVSGIDVHATGDGARLWSLRHDPADPAALAGNEVSSLLVDRAGHVWVGGFGLGLQRHDPSARGLWVRGADTDPASPWRRPSAHAVLALDDGEVWVGTHDAGVVRMDRELRTVGTVGPTAPDRPQPRVEALAQLPDGSVWQAGAGVLTQWVRAGGAPGWRPQRRLVHGAGTTHRLVATTDGTLWAATQDGLWRLPPGAGTLLRVDTTDGQPLRGNVFALAQARDGSRWIGSASGLWRIAPGAEAAALVDAGDTGDAVTPGDLRAGAPGGPDAVNAANTTPGRTRTTGAGLGNPVVLALLFDDAGQLWLDTAVTGLHRMTAWDGSRARFDRVSERLGVLGRPFGANLMRDERGRIWTQQYVYDPAADRIDELTAADGKVLGTGWFFAHAALPDGRLLFGGSRGLLVVTPARWEPTTALPRPVLTGVEVDGRSEPVAALRQRGLTLAPDAHGFAVEFAALDYADPARVRYAWRLAGFESRWNGGGADQRSAVYGALPPGEYVLQLRASNRSGLWPDDALELPVRVLPAWWQRPPVQAALTLAALAALAAIGTTALGWRTRALRRREQLLARTVAERTAELDALTQALQRESDALREASLTDPLTGLRNRRFLLQHIDADVALVTRLWEEHARHGGTPPHEADLVMFLVDIDHFKQVNDRHGHEAGDAVLRQVCERLRQVFRDGDHLVRWGGEEFLVVVRGSARDHAAGLAQRAARAVAEAPFALPDGTPLHCSCSIGFACLPLLPQQPRALGWSETVALADAALYLVKAAGRDGWAGVTGAARPLDAATLQRRRETADWAGWLGSGDLVLQRNGPGTAPT